MNSLDFYKGFEGEPEVILSRRDDDGRILEEIRLWDGYFMDMMDVIPPGQDGNWEGISIPYQFLTGWYDNTPWEYVDYDIFLQQLEDMDVSKFRFSTMEVYEEIRRLVRDCKQLNQRLFIERD